MRQPLHVDDERLAALLAGRLLGAERDELLAYLATADEDYEVFANTAGMLREMEQEDLERDRGRRRLGRRWPGLTPGSAGWTRRWGHPPRGR